MSLKIGIIGCGNMAGAIVRGLHTVDASIEFYCYNRSPEKAQTLAKDTHGKYCQNLIELKKCDFILLGVKPQNLKEIASELNEGLTTKTHIVSMLAGKSLSELVKTLPLHTHTRIMPNLPMMVGQGINLILHAHNVEQAMAKTIEDTLGLISLVVPLKSEEQLDYAMMVTASGPAYLFEVARILQLALEQKSIPKSHDIVAKLFLGSSLLMSDDFLTLKQKITSKGGVTEKALAELTKSEIDKIFKSALEQGFNHAQILNKT